MQENELNVQASL